MKPLLIHQDNWKRPRDGAYMDTSTFRVPGGIIFEMYTNGDRTFHAFSPRPYVLGQACDGTIENCVYALFYDYCEARRFDPQKLYEKAYTDELPPSQEEIHKTTRLALAEGVSFPAVWDDAAFNGLMASLTEINAHSLAATLEEAAQ